ncbi:MAG: ABC transporter permease [bacterium]|nr:ABC transporter permease [bacterium]
MSQYILKRIFLALFTLVIIMIVSYCLLRISPGDPTKSSFLGENAAGNTGFSSDQEVLSKNITMEKRLYLDKPIYIGLMMWFKDIIFYGNFGTSIAVDKGRPVLSLILERLPVTLTINFWAILITYIISIPLGVFSAVTKRKKLDRFITFMLFFLYSLPVFWVALLLQTVFCKGGIYPIFPLKGITIGNIEGLSTWQIFFQVSTHYILPIVCLSYSGFAGLSRYARASMLEVVKKDYVRTARAKGLPEYVVIFKHALRNAVITLITLFAGLIPGLIAGSIIIEYVFSIPGMGDLSMLALSSRDIPLLMSLFGFGGALTLIGILVADILYVMADPRISFQNR